MLYKRWYIESFLRALKNCLRPVIKGEDGGATIDDADNVLRHILARLVEFLYISVYRETTFNEIFQNADADAIDDLDIEETPQSETASDEDSLEERIFSLLKTNAKGMNSKKIAKALSVSKKEVNKILYENKNKFSQDFLLWKLK